MTLSSWFLSFTDWFRYERRQNLIFLDDSMNQICRLRIRDIARRLKVLSLSSFIAQELKKISSEEMLSIRKRLFNNCKFNQSWTQDMRISPAFRRRSNDSLDSCSFAFREFQEITNSHNLNTIIENLKLSARGLTSLLNLLSTLCSLSQNTIVFDDSALSDSGSSSNLTRSQWDFTNVMTSSIAEATFSDYISLIEVECQELSLSQWDSLQIMTCSTTEDVYCEFGLRIWLKSSDSTLRMRSIVLDMNSSMNFMKHLHSQSVR